jgi:CRP-like cAMP-binding protein
MRGGKKPKIRTLKEGESLVEQGKPGSEVYLVLDGMFVVEVDGVKVGEVGPGAVVGERSALERGLRTATLWAATRARVAETTPDGLDLSDLRALAETHRAEGDTAS